MTRQQLLTLVAISHVVHGLALKVRSPNETAAESAFGSPGGELLGASLASALAALWQGKDTQSTEEAHSLNAYIESIAAGGQLEQPGAAWQPKRLQILGMFDSGTNLMGALLKANSNPAFFQAACPGSGNGTGGSCFFWKHSPPIVVPQLLQGSLGQDPGSVVVAMVRSPLAQILGWEDAPYDLEDTCLAHVFDTSLREQEAKDCIIASHAGDVDGVEYTPQSFPGPTGVWNAYVDAYDELIRSDLNSNIFVVEYEKLVLHPEPIVRSILEALGFQPAQQLPFVSVEEPAKDHGHTRSRAEAIWNIEHRDYLSDWPLDTESDKMLCEHLSKDAMNRHVIPLSPPALYSSDCDPVIQHGTNF